MNKRWLGGSFFGLSVVLLLTGSVALSQGGVIYSSWSDEPVTMDGQIGAGEWVDATVLDIACEGTQAVMAYVKNDAHYLYLGVDDPNDTVEGEWGTEMGIYFDDEPPGSHDGVWNSTTCDPYPTEGNISMISPCAPGCTTGWFGMRVGTWGNTMCLPGLIPAPGVSGAGSHATGHAQWEMRIDLTTTELRASPGQTVGFYLYSWDIEDSWPGIASGEWPCGLCAADTYEDPAQYGHLVLASGGEKVFLPLIVKNFGG